MTPHERNAAQRAMEPVFIEWAQGRSNDLIALATDLNIAAATATRIAKEQGEDCA